MPSTALGIAVHLLPPTTFPKDWKCDKKMHLMAGGGGGIKCELGLEERNWMGNERLDWLWEEVSYLARLERSDGEMAHRSNFFISYTFLSGSPWPASGLEDIKKLLLQCNALSEVI